MARYWTDGEKQDVIRCWNAGMSATQIGEAMGRSRNSVISLANRLRAQGVEMRTFAEGRIDLGLDTIEKPKPAPVVPKVPSAKPKNGRIGNQSASISRVRKSLKRDPVAPELVNMAVPSRKQPQGPGVLLIHHDDKACRWPVNDPEPGQPHLFCTRPKMDGKSYCEAHNKIGTRRP